jgi:predicted site-specific integrase-resolvase
MSYTIAAAAAATGTNVTTIRRAIEDGKITGTKDQCGEWHVEPAELHRVYPPVVERGTDVAQRSSAADAVDIEAQIEALIRQAGDQLRQQLDDVKRDRDTERDQAARRPPDQGERLPWWRRIAG